MEPADTKICCNCHRSLPFDMFYKSSWHRSRRHSYCKECFKKLRKEKGWGRDKKVAYAGHINRKFGISVEDYAGMLKKQKGVCAICGQPETMIRRGRVVQLSIDHCHDSGMIRGLLCNNCNKAIGCVHEDVEILQKAISYLKKYQSKIKVI